jgi:ribonuclease HI
MYFDRSYTLKGAGAGVVLIPPECDDLKYAIQFEFSATKNIVDYKGLVNSLRLAKDLGIRRLLIRGDSQLVAKQVQKEYDCNSDMMVEYLTEVHMIEKFFDGFKVRYVSHMDNHDADHLAWIASSRAPNPPDVIIERLFKPSVKPEESTGQAESELMIIDEATQQPVDDWMSSIMAYLNNQLPSDDNTEVERIARESRMYHLIDWVLFHQGANTMMMKCISREEGIELSASHASLECII